MDRNATLTTITGLAEQLCEPHQHIERIFDRDTNRNRRLTRVWVTTQDGLLTQLLAAARDPIRVSTDDAGPRGVPGSRPPLAMEAFSTHTSITAYVARWCWDNRINLRDTTEANMRALVGATSRLDDDQLGNLAADMRGWYRQAAVMTGWQQPSFAPNAACPIVECSKRGTLRVNVDRQTAVCRACQSGWDDTDGSYGVLAAYIERSTSANTTRRARIRSSREGNGGAWHNTTCA